MNDKDTDKWEQKVIKQEVSNAIPVGTKYHNIVVALTDVLKDMSKRDVEAQENALAEEDET